MRRKSDIFGTKRLSQEIISIWIDPAFSLDEDAEHCQDSDHPSPAKCPFTVRSLG
jgi:hypothetical protein